ncbi:hypothetical protein Barb4_04332 [Bacteroidales bacterium Barb4]|nr:hypothetical protein Barb4_04332 [Bacteroidales bacterium Barb4]
MPQHVRHLKRADQLVGSNTNLPQRRGTGKTVHYLSTAQTERIAGMNKHLVARHRRRIGKEQKRARHQRHIKYIIPRPAEYFLGKDNRKSRSHGNHPQRRIHRHNHRYQYPRHQKTFLNLFALHLRDGKLNAQSHAIRHHQLR